MTAIGHDPGTSSISLNAEQRVPVAPQHLTFLDRTIRSAEQTNLCLVLELRPGLDVQLLAEALTLVAEGDEVLRMRIVAEGGRYDYVCQTRSAVALRVIEREPTFRVSDDSSAKLEELERCVGALDPLADGRLMAASVVCAGQRAWLFVKASHLAFDQHALGLLFTRWTEAYWSLSGLSSPTLGVRRYRYSDFLRDADASREQTRDFWKAQLARSEPNFLLDIDRSGERTSQLFVWRDEPCGQKELMAACRAARVWKFPFLFSLFLIALRRHASADTLLVSSTVLGRTKPEHMEMIGAFSSLILSRVVVEPSMKVGELLQDTSRRLADYQLRLNVSRRDLLEFSGRDDFAHFTFLPPYLSPAQAPADERIFVTYELLHKSTIETVPDISARATVQPDCLRVRYNYCPARLSEASFVAIADTYSHILQLAVSNPGDIAALSVAAVLARC